MNLEKDLMDQKRMLCPAQENLIMIRIKSPTAYSDSIGGNGGGEERHAYAHQGEIQQRNNRFGSFLPRSQMLAQGQKGGTSFLTTAEYTQFNFKNVRG